MSEITLPEPIDLESECTHKNETVICQQWFKVKHGRANREIFLYVHMDIPVTGVVVLCDVVRIEYFKTDWSISGSDIYLGQRIEYRPIQINELPEIDLVAYTFKKHLQENMNVNSNIDQKN